MESNSAGHASELLPRVIAHVGLYSDGVPSRRDLVWEVDSLRDAPDTFLKWTFLIHLVGVVADVKSFGYKGDYSVLYDHMGERSLIHGFGEIALGDDMERVARERWIWIQVELMELEDVVFGIMLEGKRIVSWDFQIDRIQGLKRCLRLRRNQRCTEERE